MKLLIDVNLSDAWNGYFSPAHIEAVHWKQIGSPAAADTRIFEHAAQHNFCILTRDLDFGTLLAATHAAKPSVVQLRLNDVRPENAGSRVAMLIEFNLVQLEAGALLIISEDRTRLRSLPI